MLKILVFLGSNRKSSPPHPQRLGARVAIHCADALQRRGHQVAQVDPLDISLNDVFKPHFSYAKNKSPPDLDSLAVQIGNADAYVMVSPEYNHSMSPALANLLNHFGSSLFSYKPSAIVTYSAGQWGGVRAATGLRIFLSELGCLPVSAMIHLPKAQTVFNEDGNLQSNQDSASWEKYFSRSWGQLEWWAQACKSQRLKIDPETLAEPFLNDPSQRNAGSIQE